MEASTTAETGNNEKAFKQCGRRGRRGACIDADIASEKLQDLIHQAEKLSLDQGTSSQANKAVKGT